MKKVDKVQTCCLPTPLHELTNLSREIGKGKLYIKRDDLTGIGGGGNKLRKLDYLIADALKQGCTTLLTYGGVQTNHGRLSIAAGAKYGLKTVVLCYGTPPEHMSGNLSLSRIMGGEIVFMNTDDGELQAAIERKPVDETLRAYNQFAEACTKKVIARYESQGDKVYIIPIGGHTSIGMLGYFDSVKEIMDQIEEQNLEVDYLVAAIGSGGTYAGLMLGAKYYNAPFKVIGINVAEVSPKERKELADFCNATSQDLELGVSITDDDLEIYSDTLGAGYNVPDDETREQIYRLARLEGIMIDPCYTGKSFAGFIKLLEDDRFKNKNVMYLHTGGGPALYTKEHHDHFEKELWKDLEVHTVSDFSLSFSSD